jgi:hypothetical protein
MRYFIVLLITFSLFNPICAETGSHLYSTWDTVELDTCISAWLIKKFIDKEAEFKFIPKGELVTEGTPFDTPDAEFRRKNNMSTYSTILKKYQLQDPVLKEIDRIVYEIEIAYWGETSQISKELSKKIMNIITETKDKQECFKKSFAVFDDLYEELKNERTEGLRNEETKEQKIK